MNENTADTTPTTPTDEQPAKTLYVTYKDGGHVAVTVPGDFHLYPGGLTPQNADQPAPLRWADPNLEIWIDHDGIRSVYLRTNQPDDHTIDTRQLPRL